MILRIRLENLEVDLGLQGLTIPSISDKVFDLPDTPVPADKVFEGKHLLATSPLFEVAIKWGFKGVIGHLQQKLIDDADLDSASSWVFINSSASSPLDAFEAFVNGEEVPMKGRAGFLVER